MLNERVNKYITLNMVTLILTLTLWPINSGLLTFLLLPHLSSSLTNSLPSLNLICHSKTDARFMQGDRKAVWSIPYVSVALFPSLKPNFIAYRSSKVSSCPDCIFEIHQLWKSGFSRVYSNSCCSCSFEPEITKIEQSSHNMYSNNILNFQESATIVNAHTKKVLKLIVCTSGNQLISTHTHTHKNKTKQKTLIFGHKKKKAREGVVFAFVFFVFIDQSALTRQF